MNTQLARAKKQQSSHIIRKESKSERRIVYLKEHPDTHVNVMCTGITCPGFCSCASKGK
jgi:hypothetical protein